MRVFALCFLLILSGCAAIGSDGKLELRHPADIYTYNPKFPVFNEGCNVIYTTTYVYARWHYHNRDYFLYPTEDVLRCADYSQDPEYREMWHIWGLSALFLGAPYVFGGTTAVSLTL
jgi:hypothetical protein